MLHIVNTADQKSRDKITKGCQAGKALRDFPRDCEEGFAERQVAPPCVQALDLQVSIPVLLGAAPAHKLPGTVCLRSWGNLTHRPHP